MTLRTIESSTSEVVCVSYVNTLNDALFSDVHNIVIFKYVNKNNNVFTHLKFNL